MSTEAELGHFAKAIKGLGLVLHLDRDEFCERVRLEPAERKLLDEARVGLSGILSTKRNRLEENAQALKEHIAYALDLRIQTEMFDKDGKPKTEADANGKLVPVPPINQADVIEPELSEEDSEEEDDEFYEGDDNNGEGDDDEEEDDDDIEEDDAEASVTESDLGPVTDWSTKPPEEQIEFLILEAVRAGHGKLASCQDIAGRTSKTQVIVRAVWDRLESEGIIMRDGASWMVLPDGKEPATEAPIEEVAA